MRAAATLVCAVMAAACTPEIGSGTYFCGPERFCPPEQVCDDSSFTCVNPLLAAPFSCPDGSQSEEPDDDFENATDLGELTLNQPTVLGTRAGCVPTGDDVDLFRVACDATCASGSGELEITLRYPIAFLPIEVDLLDEAGDVVVAGELCTPAVDYTGMDYLCITHHPSEGVSYVRAEGVAGAPDCDGGCAFNRYSLDIKFLR